MQSSKKISVFSFTFLLLLLLFHPSSSSEGLNNKDEEPTIKLLGGTMILVPQVDGIISALDAASGTSLWNFSTGGPLVQSSVGMDDVILSPSEIALLNTIQRDGLQDLYPEATPFMSADGTLFLSHRHSKVFAIDPLTGNAFSDEDCSSQCRTRIEVVRTVVTLESFNQSSSAKSTLSSNSKSTSSSLMSSSSSMSISVSTLRAFRRRTCPSASSSPSTTTTTNTNAFPSHHDHNHDHNHHHDHDHNHHHHEHPDLHHIHNHHHEYEGYHDYNIHNKNHEEILQELQEILAIPSLSISPVGDLLAYDSKENLLWVYHLPAPHAQLVYVLTPHLLHAIRPKMPTEPLSKVPLSLTHYKGTPYESAFKKASDSQTLALPAPDEDSSKRPVWYWIATICIFATAAIWGLVVLRYQDKGREREVVKKRLRLMSVVPRSNSTILLREEHIELQRQLRDLQLLQQQQHEQHLQQKLILEEQQKLQEQQLQEQLLKHQEQLLLTQQQLREVQSQTPPPIMNNNNNNNNNSNNNEMPVTISRYRSDFDEKERLGEGGFGTVFMAINKLDGVEYAIKKVGLTSGNSKETARVLREVRYLALLDHPNIIRYFQSWIEEDEWDDWDECRIGSRLEDFEDDDDEFDSEEESEDIIRIPRKRRMTIECSNDPYEGDASNLIDLNLSDSISSDKFNSRIKEIGVDEDMSDDDDDDDNNISDMSNDNSIDNNNNNNNNNKEENKLLSKNVVGLRINTAMDGTNERTYGSTSSPISSNASSNNRSPKIRRRKPILYIQMQYCHQGTLHHWLSRTDRVVSVEETVAIFKQAVQGVAHIHNHSVIHRDLKPPNILISADGSVKIGDFGLSTGVEDNPVQPQSPSLALSRILSRSHTTGVGSPLYCSPEQLKGERYDSKVDIFSLGVILYEMFHIFSTQMERVTHINQLRDGIISEHMKASSPELAELILQLVQFDPSLRPVAKDILSHHLITPHDHTHDHNNYNNINHHHNNEHHTNNNNNSNHDHDRNHEHL